MDATIRPKPILMFHDLNENRRHYDRVLHSKPSLYYERFDVNLLNNRTFVAELVRQAFQSVFPEKAGDLLDLGCGTGFYFPLLSQHADRLVGMDVCVPMLEEANAVIEQNDLKHCSVVQGSAMEIPFDDSSMDVVHAWDFLHHVSDIPTVLQEIHRVLRPGGRFVAFEPNLLNPSITWYHARRRSEWRLFKQNQFSIPRKLRRNFDVTVRYDNTIISFLNERTLWIWKAANRFTSVWPLDRVSFRYIIEATRASECATSAERQSD